MITNQEFVTFVFSFLNNNRHNYNPVFSKIVSILYLNSNNGGTQFKDDKFVQSKKNRLVTFPTDTYHAAVSSTDAKLRFVLNMNYETK